METLNRKNGEALGNNPNRLNGILNLPEVERGRSPSPPSSGPLKRIQERKDALDEQRRRLDTASEIATILNRYGEKERKEIAGIVEDAFRVEITGDQMEAFRERELNRANAASAPKVEKKKSWWRFL